MREATRKIAELLEIYSARGYSLERVAVLVGQKRDTLRRKAKRMGLTFADYRRRDNG